MKGTKTVTLAMPDNIYHILEFAGVLVWMFSANFGPKQFNCTLPTLSGEGDVKRSEELAFDR